MGDHLSGRPLPLIVLLLFLTALAAGCDRGPQRFGVFGRVTLDGQPLDFGSITFVPDPAGPRVSAIIEEGQYRIESSRGPLAGGKLVEIRAPRYEEGTPVPTTRGQKLDMMSVAPEALPARYNSKTELRATVTEDGPNEFNFELTSE
jgi:hypothetical protein